MGAVWICAIPIPQVNVDPEDLIPKLPKPRDLQPFPTTQALVRDFQEYSPGIDGILGNQDRTRGNGLGLGFSGMILGWNPHSQLEFSSLWMWDGVALAKLPPDPKSLLPSRGFRSSFQGLGFSPISGFFPDLPRPFQPGPDPECVAQRAVVGVRYGSAPGLGIPRKNPMDPQPSSTQSCSRPNIGIGGFSPWKIPNSGSRGGSRDWPHPAGPPQNSGTLPAALASHSCSHPHPIPIPTSIPIIPLSQSFLQAPMTAL